MASLISFRAESLKLPRMDGILNLDKPPGPSSAAMVNQIKRLLPPKTKVGHAGTLDPFATGVLLILIGKATRQSDRLMNQPKQYEATIKFGATTVTDDPESPETVTPHAMAPAIEAVHAAVARFIGTIPQRPPAFSAMKIGGRRAYDLARRGKAVDLAPRPVRIDGIQIISYDWPYLKLTIDCGRGTYIRAIARDLGADLGVGGYLTQLRRTKVGSFIVERSVTLGTLKTDNVPRHLRLADYEDI
jgi:tRNA pseudouridine55 synthase